MAINSITNSVAAQQASTYTAAKTDYTEKKSESSTKTDTGVVYEKSSDQTSGTVTKKTDYALVNKLKADAEERTSQLRSLVEKMMTKQGVAIGTADSMWSFLAKGDFTVDEATRAQAQADIADDGYWGVDQTSDRILVLQKHFPATILEKADLLLDAFKKGFKEATKSWGQDLPDISQRTYDAVVEKFNKWKNGTEETEAAQTQA